MLGVGTTLGLRRLPAVGRNGLMRTGPNPNNAERSRRRKARRRAAALEKLTALDRLGLRPFEPWLGLATPEPVRTLDIWSWALPSDFGRQIEGGLLALLGIHLSPSTPAAVVDDLALAGVMDTQDSSDAVHGTRVASGSPMPGEYAPSQAVEYTVSQDQKPTHHYAAVRNGSCLVVEHPCGDSVKQRLGNETEETCVAPFGFHAGSPFAPPNSRSAYEHTAKRAAG